MNGVIYIGMRAQGVIVGTCCFKVDTDLISTTAACVGRARFQVHCFTGHIAAITLVKWAPRDNMIFSTGQDGNVYGYVKFIVGRGSGGVKASIYLVYRLLCACCVSCVDGQAERRH